MNECYGCNTCKSADKPLEEFIAGLPLETSHHRVDGQKTKCGFGLKGVCCRLCSNGPCRITPSAPRGICGATADVIVTRNLLRAVASGSGCYIHVVENTALNLKHTALSQGAIKGENALRLLVREFGLEETDDLHKMALEVAEKVLADLYKPDYEEMELIEKLAYAPRYRKWKELGILPGGAKSEVFAGVVKCSTNLNSDPVNMLMTCLRLGISTGLYGLTLTNLLNDVMLGEPQIRMAPVGLHVIDPDYINIMITGHQHSIFVDLQERLASPEALEKAKAAGAKGFKLVGCTCVGQDLQLRGVHYTDIFDGHAGNNYTSEGSLYEFLGKSWKPLLDLIVSGKIKGVAGVVGCSNLTALGHDVCTVELTKELIKRDIIVLSAGCSSGGIENCGLMTPEAAELAGEGLKEVCKSLGIPPVLNFGPCLAIGRLEMVATALAKELNIDLPQLPLVLSAPQWLEEQALADGMFGAALGLPLHLGQQPFIAGSDLTVKVLTEDLKDITGGQVIVELDPVKAADILEQIIADKRKGLQI